MRRRDEIDIVRSRVLDTLEDIRKRARSDLFAFTLWYVVILAVYAFEIATAEKYRSASQNAQRQRRVRFFVQRTENVGN